MDAKFVLILAFVFCANAEYINRKSCRNVDPNKCSIHSVKLDPCPDGPSFCLIRRNKPYSLAFNFTPRFEAGSLKLSIIGDMDNSGSFDDVIMPVVDACEYHSCPLEDNVKQVFDIDFAVRTKTRGKFPIEVKLWNEKDESEACCFTFNVNMLK